MLPRCCQTMLCGPCDERGENVAVYCSVLKTGLPPPFSWWVWCDITDGGLKYAHTSQQYEQLPYARNWPCCCRRTLEICVPIVHPDPVFWRHVHKWQCPYQPYSTTTVVAKVLAVLFPSSSFVTSSRLRGGRRMERTNRIRTGQAGKGVGRHFEMARNKLFLELSGLWRRLLISTRGLISMYGSIELMKLEIRVHLA